MHVDNTVYVITFVTFLDINEVFSEILRQPSSEALNIAYKISWLPFVCNWIMASLRLQNSVYTIIENELVITQQLWRI